MRRGCPTGKVIHATRVEAQFVMLCLWREAQGKKGKKIPRRAYECVRCRGWHLTSMTEEEYNKKNPRQAEA